MNSPIARTLASFVLVRVAFLSIWGGLSPYAHGQPFQLTVSSPTLDRWMYPHNATPGSRPTAPVFGTLGDESGVDSRHGQFLVGFDIAGLLTTNLGPSRYLLRRARLSLTVSRDLSFALDPTPDASATYLPTHHPGFIPDSDPGRPLELFGAGFRNGYTAESFTEDAPFGRPNVGERNAFAVGYDGAGNLVDVGNNVGKTNLAFPVFEAHAFALGNSSAVQPGELVPSGSAVDFELNLTDPFVAQYLQESCHSGRLRIVLTSLQTSGFGGAPAWAEFHTRDSVLGNPPSLELEGTAIRIDDSDSDGLPDDWERHYFGTLNGNGQTDSDGDKSTDAAEFDAGTDPGRREDTLAADVSLVSAGDAIRVGFRHAPSRRYACESSDDLRTWRAIPDATIAYEVGRGWAEFVAQTTLGAGFYRVTARADAVATP